MPTRSTVLAVVHVGPALTTLFTVPAGYTYLVKSVVVNNRNGVADQVYLYLADGTGQFNTFLNEGIAIASLARLEWEGWVALNPGHSVQVASATNPLNYWISGTKLPGVA